jgi:hypothetical protein
LFIPNKPAAILAAGLFFALFWTESYNQLLNLLLPEIKIKYLALLLEINLTFKNQLNLGYFFKAGISCVTIQGNSCGV